MSIIIGGVLQQPFPFPDPIILSASMDEVRNRGRRILSLENGNYYEIEQFLKQSLYGGVYRAFPVIVASDGDYVRDSSRLPVAIKISIKNRIQLHGQEDPRREIAVLQFIQSFHGHGKEYLIQIIEACEDSFHIFTILEYEYVNGCELLDIVVEQQGRLSENKSRHNF